MKIGPVANPAQSGTKQPSLGGTFRASQILWYDERRLTARDLTERARIIFRSTILVERKSVAQETKRRDSAAKQAIPPDSINARLEVDREPEAIRSRIESSGQKQLTPKQPTQPLQLERQFRLQDVTDRRSHTASSDSAGQPHQTSRRPN